MNKQIFTIGYVIPGKDDNYVNFHEPISLMDADILLISPDSLRPKLCKFFSVNLKSYWSS